MLLAHSLDYSCTAPKAKLSHHDLDNVVGGRLSTNTDIWQISGVGDLNLGENVVIDDFFCIYLDGSNFNPHP